MVPGYFPEAMDSLDERFDCVVLNDVLEHMVDPGSALVAARRFVAPGGYVVASIPNIRYFPVVHQLVFKDRWDYADWGVLDRTHLRFFTVSTMIEMFERAGYQVARTHGINTAFQLAKWRRFRALSGRIGSAEWMQFVVVAQSPGDSR